VGGPGLKQVQQRISSYAVDPRDQNRMLITNGNQIQISQDGGCSWKPVLRLEDVPTDPQQAPIVGALATINSVYISPSHAMYALVEEFDTGASVGHPHVLYSPSGAISTWSESNSGLPPLGHPLTLKASPANPNVMYLSFSETHDDGGGPVAPCPPAPLPCTGGGGGSGASAGLMWGSADGGRTWAARTDPSDVNGASVIKYFSVDDDDPSGNTIWLVANGRLQKSTDGGRTFARPAGVPDDGFTFTAVESLNAMDDPQPIKVVAFGTGHEMLRLVGDTWLRSSMAFGGVQSVTQLPDSEIVVGTMPDGGGSANVWRIYARDFNDYEEKLGLAYGVLRYSYGWERVTPNRKVRTEPSVSGGDAGRSAVGTFYVKNDTEVLRFLGSTLRNGEFDATPERLNAPPDPVGRITPAIVTLDIPTGKSRTVDYQFSLPPAPTPIDVFLLLDNSGSMEPLISDLKSNLGIVLRRLVNAGVDVHVGVGMINVEPDPTSPPVDNSRTPDYDESKPRPIYELLRKIGPVDEQLAVALNKVNGLGGSGQEAQLESLWQSVTGEGWNPGGLGFLRGYDVKPGNDADFRTGSIRVIVHATDEEFSQNITRGHNDIPEVVRKLNDANVLQIGLSQDVKDAADDLEAVARGTHAVAPAGGVDCEGDGIVDIKPGGPLVCGTNYGLDKTLINLLGSISDRQTISLRPSRSATLRALSLTSFGIDAKKASAARFSVTYSCAGLEPGQYLNDVTAALRGKLLARTVATVNCGGVTTPPRVITPLTPVEQPAPLPQPVVPAVVPAQPISQPQTQTQPQSQVNPQAGAADQEQEQINVATQTNDWSPDSDEGEELAMSRYDHSRDWAAPGMVNIAGMALMSAVASGVALRRRTRTRVARARD
jgi:hypothetical protein